MAYTESANVCECGVTVSVCVSVRIFKRGERECELERAEACLVAGVCDDLGVEPM